MVILPLGRYRNLKHEYEGLAAVHEEEVAAKENLARQCQKVRKSLFPLGHKYEGLAAFPRGGGGCQGEPRPPVSKG
jgi:hypothetical protein